MSLILIEFLVFIFTMILSSGSTCGGITHIEISYRALNNFEDIRNKTNYDTIIRQNPEALEAGSTYPDSFYPSLCFEGFYHDVSEDTHWTPFLNASINYIRRRYPKPWDMHVQKLIAFLMGVVSHSVADISWHSLGISQGFLSTMARTNYHNEYDTAHTDGDLGGDVLNLYQLNLTYSDVIGEWYVPVTDLKNIYLDLYGSNKINETVIETCTQMMYLAKVAERLALKKYFPISARKSPFLVDSLYEYFIGGIEDMSVWTRRIWKHIAYTIENGQTQCEMPHNPLYIRCDKSKGVGLQGGIKDSANGKALYKDLRFMGSSLSDVVVLKNGRGITLKPGPKLLEKIYLAEEEFKSLHFESENQKANTEQSVNKKYPDAMFSVPTKYARLGSAFAVGDLDNDGNDDIVIGAPGYYSPSGQQNGMVFIMYGTDFGLNVSHLDVSKAADIKIPGPENEQGAHSQFGSSLAIFDMDKDGTLDIAIGAPSFGSENLTYVGKVYIFSVLGKNKFSLRAEVTCKDLYCTLGNALATGDVNSDLYHDLIVGSAFAPGGGKQRGLVGVVKADKKYRGRQGMQITVAGLGDVMNGSQNYSWFGKSINAKSFDDKEMYLAVGEPNFRKCAHPDCAFNSRDVQAVGRLHMYKSQGSEVKPFRILQGHEQFQMMGSAVAMGLPYDKFTKIVAVAMPGSNAKGHIDHIPVHFTQVGSVYLYNISNFYQYPMAVFSGNRKYGRFGAQLKFADLNRDGHEDFIIGSPLRTKDMTEELHGAEQGIAYIFLGGSDFPKGDATGNCGIFHSVEPCPGKKANYELVMDKQLARFGSQFSVVNSKNKINLLVTASHSSVGARLSGAIAVFDF